MDHKLIKALLRELSVRPSRNGITYVQAYAVLYSLKWDLKLAATVYQLLANPDFPEPDNVNDLMQLPVVNPNIRTWSQDIINITDTRCITELFSHHLAQSDTTFMLPYFPPKMNNYFKFVKNELVEQSVLALLEKAKKLNWWVGLGVAERFYPLITTGDGNCLLHAASMCVWGFHDRLLVLRRELQKYLICDEYRDTFYRRWRYQLNKINMQIELVYSEKEWGEEWEKILSMTSCEPRGVGGNSQRENYEPLEQIHILVLAHVLKRPIIVYSDTFIRDLNNQPIAPIPFGGLYLPLELDPLDCCKSPVLMSFDMSHFSAVVQCTDLEGHANLGMTTYIPLTDVEGNLLTLHYPFSPGPDFNWSEEGAQTLSDKEQLSIIKRYVQIVDFYSEPTSEDEIEQRFTEVVVDPNGTDPDIFISNKGKAAKQIQSVAKHFGSIGKTMSKKIKNIAKKDPKAKKADQTYGHIIYMEVNTKPYGAHQKLINNYMDNVQERFDVIEYARLENEAKSANAANNNSSGGGGGAGAKSAMVSLPRVSLRKSPASCTITSKDAAAKGDDPPPQPPSPPTEPPTRDNELLLIVGIKCVNHNCESFGSERTNYLCESCYNYQRHQAPKYDCKDTATKNARFGAGKSTFYRKSDEGSHSAIKNVPIYKPSQDQTLYLSKSTFFNDSEKPFGGYPWRVYNKPIRRGATIAVARAPIPVARGAAPASDKNENVIDADVEEDEEDDDVVIIEQGSTVEPMDQD